MSLAWGNRAQETFVYCAKAVTVITAIKISKQILLISK